MTPEEKKYQEFKKLGYDHIQAREMTFKHFELEKKSLCCDSPIDEKGFCQDCKEHA